MRSGIILAATAAALVSAASTAAAAPALKSSEPPRNGTITAPDHVALHFGEALSAKSSSVQVEQVSAPDTPGSNYGRFFARPATTAAGVDPADPQSLQAVFSTPLTPGLYTV